MQLEEHACKTISHTTASLSNVRHFARCDCVLNKQQVLGRGIFGKCFLGQVGPLHACIKVIRVGTEFDSSFYREVTILSQCCHTNLPFLYGVCIDTRYKMLLLSFHGINMQSFSIHALLCKKHHYLDLDVTTLQWKEIIMGVSTGMNYLHNRIDPILHNDIKEDNIVAELSLSKMRSIIIDFGKACLIKDAKRYTLTASNKEIYKNRHPHIAPDLRDGQCKGSDVFAFGRVIASINNKKLLLPALTSMSQLCLKYDATDRPSTENLHTFLTNLLLK